jgi:uncharacterized cupredoxin-like copper-binding protein
MRQAFSRAAALAVAVLALAGCGAAQRPAGGTPVRVTERDFRIAAPTQVRAGEVRFAVRNQGPVAHELIVVREASGRLPLRPDGITVNEEALDSVTAGALEPGEAGSTRELRLRLAPGRYQLFCNMSGHYLGGMHAELVVR